MAHYMTAKWSVAQHPPADHLDALSAQVVPWLSMSMTGMKRRRITRVVVVACSVAVAIQAGA